MSAGAVFRVTIEVAPEVEPGWARWHAEEHMPDLVRQPGFLGATRWRDVEPAADGWARYVVEYEAESVEAIEAYRASAESARLRADHTERYGRVSRISRTVLAAPVRVKR